MTWRIETTPRKPIETGVEIGEVYAVDPDTRLRYQPGADDPANWWVAVLVRIDRRPGGAYRAVIARPELRSIGTALGAAGILLDHSIIRQIADYPPMRPLSDEVPPKWLGEMLVEQIA